MDIFNWNGIIFDNLTGFSCANKDEMRRAEIYLIRHHESVAEENLFEKAREASSIVKTVRRTRLLKRR